MKNICIVSECQQILGVGGTETVSLLLKEGLKEQGYKVWSVYFIPKAPSTDTDIQLPEAQDIHSEHNRLRLIDAIKRNHIEIILLQGVPQKGLLELCIEAKKETGVKLVYAYHFNPLMNIKEYDDFKERLLYRKNSLLRPFYNLYFESKRSSFNKRVLNITKKSFQEYDIENIDAFVSLNDSYTEFFQSLYPQKFKEKFHTIVNPIVLDDNTPAEEKENMILFVGRLVAQKRLDRLLHIWKDVSTKHTNWKMTILGDGDYSDNYKMLAKELELHNIEFAGQRHSQKFLQKSKIICMTSSHEALPIVLIEAQKYDCVPIAYNSFESATDIIQDGHNGILVTPFNRREYVKALDSLIVNEERLAQLRKNGKEYIKKFDSRKVVKEWIKLFNKL